MTRRRGPTKKKRATEETEARKRGDGWKTVESG